MKNIFQLNLWHVTCLILFGYPQIIYSQDLFEQSFTIKFKDRKSANNFYQKGEISFLPLWGHKDWALSARFDDNEYLDNLEIKKILDQFNIKASWYVNAPDKDLTIKQAQELISHGHEIQSHGLDHIMMSQISSPEIFRQLIRSRALWESLLNKPLHSFVFPFANYPQELKKVLDNFLRAGYLLDPWQDSPFLKINSSLIFSFLLPPDGQELKVPFKKIFENDYLKNRSPLISFGIHSYAFKSKENRKDLIDFITWAKENKNIWFCTHGQFAAYRYQVLNSKVKKKKLIHNKIVVQILRPSLLDLGRDLPIGIILKGEKKLSNKLIEVNTMDEIDWPLFGDPLTFHLYPPQNQVLPQEIFLQCMPHLISQNKSKKRFILDNKKEFLEIENYQDHLKLTNLSKKDWSNLRVLLRVGVDQSDILPMLKKTKLKPEENIIFPLNWKKETMSQNEEQNYGVLQIDVKIENKAYRLWIENRCES